MFVGGLAEAILGFYGLVAIAFFAVVGLVIGGVSYSKGRQQKAIFLMGISAIALIGLGVFAYRTLYAPRREAALDLSLGARSVWNGGTLSCQRISVEEYCFPASGRYTLKLKLPDQSSPVVVGEQFLVRLREAHIKGLDLVLKPDPSEIQLERMLAKETSLAETSKAKCAGSDNSDPVLRFKQWSTSLPRLATNRCEIEFQHNGYTTSYEISPEDNSDGSYFVWYRVGFHEQPGG